MTLRPLILMTWPPHSLRHRWESDWRADVHLIINAGILQVVILFTDVFLTYAPKVHLTLHSLMHRWESDWRADVHLTIATSNFAFSWEQSNIWLRIHLTLHSLMHRWESDCCWRADTQLHHFMNPGLTSHPLIKSLGWAYSPGIFTRPQWI